MEDSGVLGRLVIIGLLVGLFFLIAGISEMKAFDYIETICKDNGYDAARRIDGVWYCTTGGGVELELYQLNDLVMDAAEVE